MYTLDYPKTPMLELSQLEHYSLVIVDTSALLSTFRRAQEYVQSTFLLAPDEMESVFDWCVAQGLQEALDLTSRAKVIGHRRHDIYRCVYDEQCRGFSMFFQHVLMSRQLVVHSFQPIKCLAMGHNTIVAVGEPKNA